MLTTVPLGDSLHIAVRQGASFKKIIKLSFTQSGADLYVMLPYLKLGEYRCGLVEAPSNSESATFDVTRDSQISPVPVKLSYHESGKVHFKPDRPVQGMEPKLKLAEIWTKPISNLNGDHIFTVEFEGLDAFEDAKQPPKNGEVIAEWSAPDEIRHFKFVAYARFTQQSVVNKYSGNTSPNMTIILNRTSQQRPLHVGVYGLGGDSIRTDSDKPYILATSGYERRAARIRFLFLHAAAT